MYSNQFADISTDRIYSYFFGVFRMPCAMLLCSLQGETPWNPEILSHEPKLNDSSGAFYACCAVPGVGDRVA